MTVLQAIPLNIYTLGTLRSDESAGYITLGRTSDISARDTDGDDLRSAGIWMDGDDFFMSNPMDDFSDLYACAAGTPLLACIAPKLVTSAQHSQVRSQIMCASQHVGAVHLHRDPKR